MALVTFEEITLGTPQKIAVTTTAITLLPSRLNKTHRKVFYIVPLTAGVVVTLVPTERTAVALEGYVLTQYQPYLEVRSENFEPYQGQWNIVASGNGDVAVVEQVDPK